MRDKGGQFRGFERVRRKAGAESPRRNDIMGADNAAHARRPPSPFGKVALCVSVLAAARRLGPTLSRAIYSPWPESCCAGILGDWVSFKGLIVSHKSEGDPARPLALAP